MTATITHSHTEFVFGITFDPPEPYTERAKPHRQFLLDAARVTVTAHDGHTETYVSVFGGRVKKDGTASKVGVSDYLLRYDTDDRGATWLLDRIPADPSLLRDALLAEQKLRADEIAMMHERTAQRAAVLAAARQTGSV
jgi:hypothetical protein